MSRDAPTLAEQYGPGAGDFEPTELEEDVLEALECLDSARDNARSVLTEIFLRIVAARLPVGTRMELSQSRVISGNLGQARNVEITAHHAPEIDLGSPEMTRVRISARPVLKDGRLGRETVGFKEHVIGTHFVTFGDFKKSERDRLCELVAELVKEPTKSSQIPGDAWLAVNDDCPPNKPPGGHDDGR